MDLFLGWFYLTSFGDKGFGIKYDLSSFIYIDYY